MEVEKKITLDLLDIKTPALSATSDVPVIETKPDSTPADKPKAEEKAAPEGKKPEKADKPEGEKAAPEKSAASEKPEKESPASDETEGLELESEADVRAEQKEPSKKSKGVQKRLDELVRQREDERRAREATEARLDRALASIERLTGKPAADAKQELAEEDPEPVRPVKASFPYDNAYEQARDEYTEVKASWIARREIQATIAEREKKAVDLRTQEENQRVQTTYKERVDKASEKYQDYFEVAESPDVAITVPMAHAIMASEFGPDIQYQLGKEPAEAKRISELSVPQQLLALGRIEAKLAAEAAPKKEVSAAEEKPAAAKPAAVSSAPPPVAKLKGGPSESTKSPEDMSMDEYAAMRKKQLAAERRPGVR